MTIDVRGVWPVWVNGVQAIELRGKARNIDTETLAREHGWPLNETHADMTDTRFLRDEAAIKVFVEAYTALATAFHGGDLSAYDRVCELARNSPVGLRVKEDLPADVILVFAEEARIRGTKPPDWP